QAAVDAARTAGTAGGGVRGEPRLLVVPRLAGKYGAVGTIAVLEQVGRLPGGEPGAVLRGQSRARVGSGVNGPGAALWVEATTVGSRPPTSRRRSAWPPCARSTSWSAPATSRPKPAGSGPGSTRS